MTAVKDKQRWWGISRKRWDDERVDDLGDRGPWEDQGTLSRLSRHDAGNTTQLERADGSSTGYRYTGGGWRVIEGSATPPTTDTTDPDRGTLQQNATNWRGSAGRWRDRAAQARAEGDEAAAAQFQDEADTSERIADVIERYPHVKVLEITEWTYDPATGLLDDGGLFEHQLPSPEGYREHAEYMRAYSEIVETGDPLRAAAMRNQAEDWERKADDKEADAALNAAVDDFEKAAGVPEPEAEPEPQPARQPNPPPVLPPPPSQPPPTPPPTTPSSSSSGASMSGSIGDAAAGIRGANDIADGAIGTCNQAIAQVEEARGQMQAAAAGSDQADVGEAMGLFSRAIDAIQDAQKAIAAATAAAASVAARL